ncbi:MAG: hypothetical protein I3273_07500 [Candidatus Moeniiplasma glomeromycotorum]|nr:hypothetical protein [Candidatus Moeniiplasma glomeromycotorum]MCE8168443.1 hypothetical protein [Candidatus Moeniiplasma glomeromycotorum]MCE8169932.1 hypothetical protein [Candidatus Moeniiplasma glomeromycotorum]
MTDIKIPFTKNKISHIPASDLNPGSRGVQLEITTNFRVFDLAGSFEKAVPPVDSKVPFEKINFIFKDSNTETDFYNSLCDSDKKQFELSFDKEKVWLNIAGFSNEIDKTKPQVTVNFKDLVIFFDPKFSGIIKLTTDGQPLPSPQPRPNPPQSSIQFTKKNARKINLDEPGAQGVEMETEPFVLNFPRHGDKTFEKVVVIDNKSQNSDKLNFLLGNANQNIQINFLKNAKIAEPPVGAYTADDTPNVSWMGGDEKQLVIYLNDVFGFKPNEISISKAGESPEKPKDNKDKERERERERERDKPNGPDQPTKKPSQQEITNLKTELNQVKNDLKKLKEFIKKLEDKKRGEFKDNSDLENILKEGKNRLKELEKKNAPQTSSPDKGFWRKEVVIPVVLVLAIIIFIGVFFWIRKKRIKDS